MIVIVSVFARELALVALESCGAPCAPCDGQSSDGLPPRAGTVRAFVAFGLIARAIVRAEARRERAARRKAAMSAAKVRCAPAIVAMRAFGRVPS